jgi:hypothetical protein
VSSGQIYTFQFVPTQGGGIPDPYGVNVIATDAYSGGNDLGEPTWDLCFRTYVDVTTGTNDPMVENSAAVYVYPNPAGNLVSVRCKNGFQLFSLEGRLIK